jgi:hypothetical protein
MKPVTIKSVMFEQKVILALSLPMIALLITCSTVGLLYPEIYHALTPNWMTQTVVQDGLNLLLVAPVLITAALYSFHGVRLALLIWGGTVAYLVYTFLIYCFAVRFNVLFLAYCAILGLSVFSLAWFVRTQARNPAVKGLANTGFLKTTGIYFIVIAVLFYLLWLLEIVPASLAQESPESLVEIGLITNPVQVIDLSVLLPAVFVAGVITLRGNSVASIVIPVVLVFFILMDASIAALAVVLAQKGFGGSLMVAAIMGTLGLFSVGLAIWYVWIARGDLSN